MKKEAYNFKEAFEHPMIIRQLSDNFSLPFGIRVSRFVLGVVILGILWIFRDFVDMIGSIIPGLGVVLYIGLPYLLSGWLLKLNMDGKKIHFFLYDYFVYLFSIKLPKKEYCYDEEVLYLHEKEIRFEPFEWKVRRKNVKNTTESH